MQIDWGIFWTMWAFLGSAIAVGIGLLLLFLTGCWMDEHEEVTGAILGFLLILGGIYLYA